MELSSSEAAEQAGSRHPGKRLITFLPPCCFPSHLGMEKGIGELAVFPAFSVSKRRMKEMHWWIVCQLEQLLPRHLCVLPCNWRWGRGWKGRQQQFSALNPTLKFHWNPQEPEQQQHSEWKPGHAEQRTGTTKEKRNSIKVENWQLFPERSSHL